MSATVGRGRVPAPPARRRRPSCAGPTPIGHREVGSPQEHDALDLGGERRARPRPPRRTRAWPARRARAGVGQDRAELAAGEHGRDGHRDQPRRGTRRGSPVSIGTSSDIIEQHAVVAAQARAPRSAAATIAQTLVELRRRSTTRAPARPPPGRRCPRATCRRDQVVGGVEQRSARVTPAGSRSCLAGRSRTAAARRPARRRSGRMKIQFCQAVSRPKILVSSVSGPTKRWLASMPVSASGDSDARSSSTIRSSSSKSMSSSAIVTRPSSSAARGVERLADTLARGRQLRRRVPRTATPAGRGRCPSGRRRRWPAVRTIVGGFGVGVDVLVDALEHVLPVAGQGQLEQQAGEAAAGLDDGDQAAAGHVEPLERALEVVADLVDEPVAGQLAPAGRRTRAPGRGRRWCGAPRCRARSRWCAAAGPGRRAPGSRPSASSRRPGRARHRRRPAARPSGPAP